MEASQHTDVSDKNTSHGATSVEEPLFVLKINNDIASLIVFLVIIIYIFLLFGFAAPVLTTGNYSSMLIYDKWVYYKNVIMFYGSFFYILYITLIMPRIIKIGSYYFYNNRVEVDLFFSANRKRKIIYFNDLYCTMYFDKKEVNKVTLILTRKIIPNSINLFVYYKIRFLYGFSLTIFINNINEKQKNLQSLLWVESKDINDIIVLLREKANFLSKNDTNL